MHTDQVGRFWVLSELSNNKLQKGQIDVLSNYSQVQSISVRVHEVLDILAEGQFWKLIHMEMLESERKNIHDIYVFFFS